MAEQESNYIETEIEIEGRIIKMKVPQVETLPAWEATEIVGKSVTRVDAYEKVIGSARYTIDVAIEGMLYGKILRSPHASARVKKLDISKAAATPGVVAILTYEDAKEYKIGSSKRPVPLMTDTIRYAGEEIAALAAIDPYIAEDAMKRIEIEYETTPHVINPMESMNATDRKFYPEGNFAPGGWGSGNKPGEPNVYERGNIEQGFRDADFIIESQYETAAAQHACMEVHCSVVKWEGDKLIVWDSTQGVFGVQEELANVLHLPLHAVKVIGTYMGGGFGSKTTAHKFTLIAALLAKKAHKPVKMVLERSEDFISQYYRPASIQYLKAGVKKDGKLTALFLKAIHQVGAYMFSTAWGNCSAPAKELYACDNVRTEDYAVFTNTPAPTPMRAPGHTQGIWALEQFIDEIAEKVKMDSLEFRKINYAEKDPVTGFDYASKGLAKCVDMAVTAAEWNSKKISKERKNPQKLKMGIGAALQIWSGGGGPPASAIIKLNEDGTANLITGAADLGTGTRTVLSQIASEELGIPLSSISIINADTEFATYTLPSYGSITLASSGPAVRSAAADAKNQLLEFASGLFNAKADDLVIKDSFIYAKKSPADKKKINEITSLLPNRIIIGRGLRGPNPKNKSLRTFGIQIAEVEVNTRTGEIKLLKITAVHDCGLVINPTTWKSQIHGGICMGIGYALSEERLYNYETGLHLNPSLLQYKIPTVKDIPIEIIILDSQVKYDGNLIGAKGAGEPPVIPTAAAIANAVYDAIGVRIKSTPITPDKILQALYSLSGGKK